MGNDRTGMAQRTRTAEEGGDHAALLSQEETLFGEDEEEYYITDKEERIICRMKYMSTEPDNAAYIVAACNAVPRLIEMLVFIASLASEDDESVDAIERRIQWAYNETRPKE